jgi:thioredoxin 1
MVVHSIKTSHDFHEVINKYQYVLIDFCANWCGPCKKIAPFVEELSNKCEYSHIYFCKIDVDEVDEVSNMFDVQSLPTFIILKESKVINKFEGASNEKLINLLSQLHK